MLSWMSKGLDFGFGASSRPHELVQSPYYNTRIGMPSVENDTHDFDREFSPWATFYNGNSSERFGSMEIELACSFLRRIDEHTPPFLSATASAAASSIPLRCISCLSLCIAVLRRDSIYESERNTARSNR